MCGLVLLFPWSFAAGLNPVVFCIPLRKRSPPVFHLIVGFVNYACCSCSYSSAPLYVTFVCRSSVTFVCPFHPDSCVGYPGFFFLIFACSACFGHSGGEPLISVLLHGPCALLRCPHRPVHGLVLRQDTNIMGP